MIQNPIKSLGDVMQLAYVTTDLAAAARYWTQTMGVGPFFKLEHAQRSLDSLRYRGKPCEADFTMMIAYWGDIQVELIQQHNDAPSIFRGRHGRAKGLHHVCIMVDDLAAAVADCTRAGALLIQEGRSGGSAFVYMDTFGGPGSVLEILSPAPEVRQYQTYMRECAKTWDGRQPIRTFET